MSNKIEKRVYNIPSQKVEIRQAENGAKVVRGYAAMFDSPSEDFGGWYEVIANGAFDSVLGNDVRVLFNHNSDKVLGRTVSGTARIGVDSVGLWYEYDSPDTATANELVTLMERGDINQCSFAFSLGENGDTWVKEANQKWKRTILNIGRLYDVGPVTYPAYPDTVVGLRDGFNAANEVFERVKQESEEPVKEFKNSLTRIQLSI